MHIHRPSDPAEPVRTPTDEDRRLNTLVTRLSIACMLISLVLAANALWLPAIYVLLWAGLLDAGSRHMETLYPVLWEEQIAKARAKGAVEDAAP
jgi:hypothetical protein